jgi:hypothetical protein
MQAGTRGQLAACTGETRCWTPNPASGARLPPCRRSGPNPCGFRRNLICADALSVTRHTPVAAAILAVYGAGVHPVGDAQASPPESAVFKRNGCGPGVNYFSKNRDKINYVFLGLSMVS